MADFDIAKPVDALKIGDIPQWFRDVQIVLKDLIQREHATVAGTLAAITGAEHKSGSAKAYVQDAAPTKRPDTSTNLGADDAGRIWFDSDDDYLMHIHDGTDWDTTIETMINAMDGLNLAENFAIGTDKFTVAAEDGDTAIDGDVAIGGDATVGGTLDVTGVTTLGDGSKLASAAAPDADAEIANKKYVDDEIALTQFIKAWVNFNGTAGDTIEGEFRCTIRASYNVSKVVRHSTGHFAIHFTSALEDADYVLSGSVSGNDPHHTRVVSPSYVNASTSSVARIIIGTPGGNNSTGQVINAETTMVQVIR